MTDHELLEASAKAAGLVIDKSPYNGGGAGNTGFDMLGNAMLDWHNNVRWNPLNDDGDAFRLLVVLCGASFEFFGEYVDLDGCMERYADHGGDRAAAARRVLVRVAAGDRR